MTLQDLIKMHNELVRRLVERDRNQASELNELRQQVFDLQDTLHLVQVRLDVLMTE
jgi:hypothetical protein